MKPGEPFYFGEPAARTSRRLPDEMRAAIDAAIAAGKVRVIPQGVSGLEPFIWSEARGELVERSSLAGKRAIAAAEAAKEKAPGPKKPGGKSQGDPRDDTTGKRRR